MRTFRDDEDNVWEEQEDGTFQCSFPDGSSAWGIDLEQLELYYGPLEEEF